MSDDDRSSTGRRTFLSAIAGATAATALTAAAASDAKATTSDAYADPPNPALQKGNMVLDAKRAALVVIDPQIDFLSPNGLAWPVVGESVTEHNVVPNLGRLFETAKAAGMTVAISPHYYYHWDHAWKVQGPLEVFQHKIGIFDRQGPYTLDGFRGSGADFLPDFKKYIEDGKTIICSPHKLYGPQVNDLPFQLRKQRVDRSFLLACLLICASNRICANFSNWGLKLPWSVMPSRRQRSLKETATYPLSSIFDTWRTAFGRRRKPFVCCAKVRSRRSELQRELTWPAFR